MLVFHFVHRDPAQARLRATAPLFHRRQPRAIRTARIRATHTIKKAAHMETANRQSGYALLVLFSRVGIPHPDHPHIRAGLWNHQHAHGGNGVRPQHHRDIKGKAQRAGFGKCPRKAARRPRATDSAERGTGRSASPPAHIRRRSVRRSHDAPQLVGHIARADQGVVAHRQRRKPRDARRHIDAAGIGQQVAAGEVVQSLCHYVAQ